MAFLGLEPAHDEGPRHRPDSTSLRAWFAFLLGGWNASAGVHCGRREKAKAGDEEFARHVLETHRKDVEKPLREQLTKLKAQLHDAESALAVQCEMTARYKEAADAEQRYRQSGAAAKALQEAEQARNENACALADAVKSRDVAEKQAEIYRQETHRWSAAYRAEKEQREAAEHRLTRHRNFVFDALRSVVHKIEICGASAELTNAVTAAGDLACAVGSVDVDYGPGYRELVLDAIRKQNERDGVPFRPERYDAKEGAR